MLPGARKGDTDEAKQVGNLERVAEVKTHTHRGRNPEQKNNEPTRETVRGPRFGPTVRGDHCEG